MKTKTLKTYQHRAIIRSIVDNIDNDGAVVKHCNRMLVKLNKYHRENRAIRLQLKQWSFDYANSNKSVESIIAEATAILNR